MNSTAANAVSTISIPANMLLLHAGDDDAQAAILQLNAPRTAYYEFTGVFERRYVTANGTGVTAEEYFNGTIVDSKFINLSGPTPYNFDHTLSLNSGDVVTFSVARVGGNYRFGSTSLQLVANEVLAPVGVPEPASIGILMLGLAGLASSRRRRVASNAANSMQDSHLTH